MLTTITTATAAIIDVAGNSLVGIAIVTVILLLILKEIASGLSGKRATRFSRGLNVALVPLMFVFVTALVAKAISTFR